MNCLVFGLDLLDLFFFSMANEDDLLSFKRYADSGVFQLTKMRENLAQIYEALSSVQVLVCDDFLVFVLVYFLFQGDGVSGCLPELQGLLLRVSILFFFGLLSLIFLLSG